jgi:hypothetical protein
LRSYGPTAFVRNPETEKIVRRKRPKSEWITHQNEGLRIVSDELFAKAQARTRDRADPSKKLKAGGKSEVHAEWSAEVRELRRALHFQRCAILCLFELPQWLLLEWCSCPS